MTYQEFLTRVIDDGIEAAKRDYGEGEKLEGSVKGFESCRGKNPPEILDLLVAARKACHDAYRNNVAEGYWGLRCCEAEIEWVANCVSAMLVNQGVEPLTSTLPTARGVMKAAQIIGVKSEETT